MFRPRTTGERPDEGLAHPPTLVATRWAAYSLMLTAGVLLFGVIPADDAPVAPVTTHQHLVQTNRVPAGTPRQGQLPAPQLATQHFAAHQHTTVANERGHHVHIRLSPRQLSLAKW